GGAECGVARLADARARTLQLLAGQPHRSSLSRISSREQGGRRVARHRLSVPALIRVNSALLPIRAACVVPYALSPESNHGRQERANAVSRIRGPARPVSP